MRKLIFYSLIMCIFAGCAEIDQQGDSTKEGGQAYRGLPVEVVARGDKGLPVKVITGVDEGIPVRLDIEGDETVPVRLDIREDSTVPVEIKLSQKTLLFVAIAGGIIVLIAVAGCLAAIAAARSAKAVSKSVDAIEKIQRQREAGQFSGENG